MKAKNRKLHQIIGILLCLVLLIGLVPAHIVMADDAVKPQADGLVEYERVTSTDGLEDGQYVIVYKEPTTGTRYALSTEGPNYCAEITQEDSDKLMVDPSGNYVFTMNQNGDKYNFKATNEEKTYLKLNSGNILFDTSAGGITLANENGYWSFKNSRGLKFSTSTNAFGVTSEGKDPVYADFELWKQLPTSTNYIKLAYLEQLADFDSTLDFVIAVDTKDGLKALGAKSNGSWLHDIKEISKDKESITIFDTEDVVFNVQQNADNEIERTSGMYNQVKYWGFGNYGIQLKTSKSHYYPQYLDNENFGYPLRNGDFDSKKNKINYSVQFEYGTGDNSNEIYIRGNGGSTYLGYTEDGRFTGTLTQDSPNRVAVQIYVAVPEDAVRIEFLKGDSNEAQIVTYADPNGTLSLTNKVDDVENHNGYTYTFVGWTLTKPESSYLSLDESCNIFDYDNKTETTHILDSVAKKFDLIGDCNPERTDAQIDLSKVGAESGGTVKLYPIYAVRGFDSVVAALEADDTKIIGVSDWKADPSQGESEGGVKSYYDGGDRERWLGYIDVQMFKDGVEWVAPTRLYFRYHNDDSADLSIKFIWDELLDDDRYIDPIGDLDPLYLYMSDHDQYPLYDQSGHFVLDAVYATQGGSEDGLKYSLNWMTDHGGQLDNVRGGSLVQLFVSTRYDVKYYLDDEEITTGIWGASNYSDTIYTTPGTERLFNEIASDAEYKVRFDNDLIGLMDRDIVEVIDPEDEIIYNRDEDGNIIYDEKGNPDIIFNPHEWFIAEDLIYDEDGNVIGVNRGEPDTYSYVMHEYRHDIPLAKSPEELVPEGRSLISKMWSLKDKSMKFQSAHEWASAYSLKGTNYGTGNTAASYFDGIATFAADDPYTFHLYAYTGIPGDIKITNTVTGEGGDKNKEFHYTITLESTDDFDAEDVNGWYGDLFFEKGVAQFTLKDGESVTAEGLPAGVTYTVVELEFNDDGYASTVAKDKGTIPEGGLIQVDFVNDKPIEKPAEPKPTTSPQTGNESNLTMWMFMMLISLLGMAFCISSSKKKARNAK